MKHAVCVFVKTPELSPVKTRLAKSIGEKKAIAFYEKSVHATDRVLLELKRNINDLDIIWAVAEKEALLHSRWSGKTTVWQQDGDLGARLCHIETWAFHKYKSVLFYGADSPHVKASILVDAYERLAHNDVVIGPCEDGGFYFLLTSTPLTAKVWTQVTYSQDQTLNELKFQIQNYHKNLKIYESEKNFDIDTSDEYLRLCQINPAFSV